VRAVIHKGWATFSLVIVSLSISLVHCLAPYDVVVAVNFPVRVSPSAGAVWHVTNVTFELSKLQPPANDRIYVKWLRSDYDHDPPDHFYFDLKVNLTGRDRNHTYTFKRLSFERSGEYSVRLSHQFRSVPSGKYILMIEYPLYFKAGVIDSTRRTMAVVFF